MRNPFVPSRAGKVSGLLLTCMALSGCMSVRTLGDGDGIYRGVRGDLDCIRTAQANLSGKALLCEAELPFSLVFDTVFLPFTLVDTLRQPSETESP